MNHPIVIYNYLKQQKSNVIVGDNSVITLYFDESDLRKSYEIWRKYLENLINMFYHRYKISVDDPTRCIAFCSNKPDDDESYIWGKCVLLDDNLLKVTDKNYNILITLYQGFSNPTHSEENVKLIEHLLELVNEHRPALIDTKNKNSCAKIFDLTSVLDDNKFHVEKSTKNLIDKLYSYLIQGKIKKAAAIMNFLEISY